MKKRIISLVLVLIMSISICVPAFADSDNTTLPPWVDEGETWFPVGDIMPLEDFGLCPRGHAPPEGFKFEGYTTGRATANFDGLARVFRIISIFSGDAIIVSAGALAGELFDWLDSLENPNAVYFKYVYTKEGRAPFIHIIYSLETENTGNGKYIYLSCETYFQI